jgi:putative transcriptional regulator
MSRILDNVRADAKALHDAGLLDDITMREIDALCLPEVRKYTAEEIRRIRAETRVSQAVFARCLNVGATTVQKWEQGIKRPGGASLRLLQIIEAKGLDAITIL